MSGRSLVPDSPGPLSIIRSLRPDRHSGGRAGERRRRWFGASPPRAASPEAAADGSRRKAGARRVAARRVVEWALSAVLSLLVIVLALGLAIRTVDGGGGATPMVV